LARILLLSNFFPPCVGGVETHLSDLCEALTTRGHTIQVVTFHPSISQPGFSNPQAETWEKHANLEIHRIRASEPYISRLMPRFHGTIFEFLYFFPPLFIYTFFYATVRRKEFDVIHSHGLVPAAVGLVLSKLLRKRSWATLHWMVGLKSRPLLRRFVKAILLAQDGVLTMTLGSRTELIQTGLDPRRVVSFRYWVNLENFHPGTKAECKETLGLKGRFIVLFVGRLIEEKGVTLFIDMARQLGEEEKNGNLLFVMVGDGPLRPLVERSGKSLENFHLAGRVNNTEMPLYYRAADVLVVPSIRAEGFPRVIPEALSCGTPVIGSNLGGISEAIDPSVGLIVEPDLPSFVNAVRTLYSDTTTLEKMVNNARNFAVINFSKRNADTIESSLNGSRMIGGNRAHSREMMPRIGKRDREFD